MNPDDLRNWLSSVASDLRGSKVLPAVVVVLIAAAVAIPLLLSQSGKAASLAAVPPAPVVTAPNPAATTTASGRHHEPAQNYLTGPSHNPFIAKTTTTSTSPTTSTSTSSSAPAALTSTVGSSASSGASGKGARGIANHTVTVPAPATTRTVSETTTVSKTTTVPAKQPYASYEAEVSLLQAGAGTTPTVFHNLARDQLLPADAGSFATFLGVRTDKRTAVFVLSDDSTVTGTGECAPSATSCTFLTVRPGASVTVVVSAAGAAPATYTLAYLKIRKVSSDASTVTVDPTGAAAVKEASSYVTPLSSIRYAQYTGLLSIDLGSTVAVTP